MKMLNALIKAKNDLTNIRDIVQVKQQGGKQFATCQTMPSVTQKTLRRYANNGTSKISQDSGMTALVAASYTPG
jgi:hypothetical protein